MFRRLFSGGLQPSAPDQTAREPLDQTSTVEQTVDQPESDVLIDEALGGLLSKMRRAAVDVLAGVGLPTREGTYRRSDGVWSHLADRLSPEEKWSLVLATPPEAGFTYGRLSDVARDLADGRREVLAAADVLSGIERLEMQLDDGSGGWDPRASSAVQAGMEVLFSLNTLARTTGRRLLPLTQIAPADDIFRRTALEQRHWAWSMWRAEADAIRRLRPGLSERDVAALVKRSLRLDETLATVLKRIRQDR